MVKARLVEKDYEILAKFEGRSSLKTYLVAVIGMTLDWTNASSLMGLYLVPANTCAAIEGFHARTGNFLVRSEPPGAKPRKVSAANFQAGNYRVLIANFSDADESAALHVILSKGTGCPAIAGAQPSALSRADAPALVVQGMVQR